ncbi:MAG: transglycosylase domain-containing protein [Tissierellia bacterium]|nr:transglycosylase domain-containing protein [Tissierellia bacterium]
MKNIIGKLPKRDRIHVILLSILILILIMITLFFSAILHILIKSPETNLDNLSFTFHQTSSIFKENGTLLEKIESEEFRTVIPLEQVPQYCIDAFISIEDQRFYEHHGIDPQGIAGSVLANLKSGRMVRGGSTITQQLVKNVYLTNEKSFERKIREAYLSLRVEHYLTKDEILEAYLNRINLGQGAYGVQGAAQTYFSKNIEDLSLAQCALLAGIVKSPRDYQPLIRIPSNNEEDMDSDPIGTTEINGIDYNLYFNPESIQRQKVVLHKMLELGYINNHEFDQAIQEDLLGNINPVEKKQHDMSSYALDFIKAQATEELANYYKISLEEAEHKLFTGGYQIFSTVDTNLQHELEDIYINFVDYINSNTSSRKGAKMLDLSFDTSDNIIDQNGDILFFRKNNVVDESFQFIFPKDTYSFTEDGSLQLNKRFFHNHYDVLRWKDIYTINNDKNLLTYSMGDLAISKDDFEEKEQDILISSHFIKEHPDFCQEQDHKLYINSDYYDFDSSPILQPQSSTVIIDNELGYVKAIVGGLDIQSKSAKIYNRASMSPRQPGTAILPFTVYGPALQKGFHMGSSFDDALEKYDSQWWPENPSGKYYGYLTLRKAFETNSYTIPSKILQKIGFDPVLNSLSHIRLYDAKHPDKDRIITPEENPDRNDFTLDAFALGNLVHGVTNLELTEAYMALEHDGIYRPGKIITMIKDSTGNPIVENKNPKGTSIYTKENAFFLKDILVENARKGTAANTKLSRIPTGANIGINKFHSDLWVIGFTPKYTIGTWIGCDTPKIPLNSSPDTVIELWSSIGKMAHENLNSLPEFEVPENVVKVNICSKNGKLATNKCYNANAVHEEYFVKGTEPTEYCTDHISLNICSSSGRLITKYCPDEKVLFKTYFKRENPYPDGDKPSIYPMDYHSIPHRYCNIHTRDWYEEQMEDEDNGNEKGTNND